MDPDGLRDDRSEVLLKKLTTDDGLKLKLPFLCETTNDLWVIPRVTIYDFYNYLQKVDHAILRDHEKMEG